MKKNLLLLLLVAFLMSCNHKSEPAKLTMTGVIENYDEVKNLYLFDVLNEHYGYIQLIDSIAITDGKFTYANDTLQTQLYVLSTHNNPQTEETFKQGAYVLLRKGSNDMKVYKDADGRMLIDTPDFLPQQQFAKFTKEKYQVSNSKMLDSITELFYAARDRGDREEMKRINETTTPLYEESATKTKEWIDKKMEENPASLFGLYLFYTYGFQNYSFSTLDETAKIRTRLQNLDPEAKQSAYFTKIEERLTLIENCAVGSKAPEITGLDTLNNEVKLSDLKGKYVLVDFWSSGCSWCRKETPNLQKTYDAFTNKNFTILGVSSDYKKEDWTGAIHEDKSYWNHIMLRREDINSTMKRYTIVGIPEILLIDPQGVILAKGLRGDDIYNTVAQHVK